MTSVSPTRRDFLALVGAGSAALLVAGCSASNNGALPVSASGASFLQPAVLTSRAARLEVTLRAEARQVPYGKGTRFAYTYNGSTPGPTLRVRPGDRLIITLENRLDHDTNLHTHGLHVSPAVDDIFLMIPAGASHIYTYDIPADHRSGLFWYHPHVHEHVAEQVAAGLAGAIIVADDLDDIAEIAASTERIWILADPPIGTTSQVLSVSGATRMQGREGDQVLVNGIHQPRIDATAGTLERWRLVNASASRYYLFAVDSHPLHVIATDGGRLAAPTAVDSVLIAPGERVEVIVAPTHAGTFTARSLAYQRGSTMGMGGGMMGGRSNAVATSEATLASMTVSGTTTAASALPARLAEPSTLALPTPSATRTVVLAMGGGSGMMNFTIDGRTFDPARTDITTRIGLVEEWVIRNTSTMDHPFHLHTWPFQIAGAPPVSGWKDTVNVPANSEIRIRVPFVNFSGRTVYHCHILDHEDLGMMGV
ncbi:MAG: multicopper oxidase family protein, partial [Acidimicrobiales bacterium]